MLIMAAKRLAQAGALRRFFLERLKSEFIHCVTGKVIYIYKL